MYAVNYHDTGHIGIHAGLDGRTDVCTAIYDVMATKPNFLASMGYHIFLTMVLRAHGALLLIHGNQRFGKSCCMVKGDK